MSIFRITLRPKDKVRIEELMTCSRAIALSNDLYCDELYHESMMYLNLARSAKREGKGCFWDSVSNEIEFCHLDDKLLQRYRVAEKQRKKVAYVCVY